MVHICISPTMHKSSTQHAFKNRSQPLPKRSQSRAWKHESAANQQCCVTWQVGLGKLGRHFSPCCLCVLVTGCLHSCPQWLRRTVALRITLLFRFIPTRCNRTPPPTAKLLSGTSWMTAVSLNAPRTCLCRPSPALRPWARPASRVRSPR